MQEKIWCFSSPSRDVALAHPKGHFSWMLNGEALFRALIPRYPLFEGGVRQPDGNFCFETFPHAVACALAGGVVSAKKKGAVRRDLLRRAGLEIAHLTNIDKVDAALCALAASYFLSGCFREYGSADAGVIVVPGASILEGEKGEKRL